MGPIRIYCPMWTAQVAVRSDRTDDMGQFTKFILWAITAGYRVEEISETISLPDMLVEEEIAYLLKIGFVIANEDQYSATETGCGYIEMESILHEFNEKAHRVRVNAFTGEIMQFHSGMMLKRPAKNVLPESADWFLVQCEDYKQLKEFAEDEYSEDFSSMRPEFAHSLHFYLRFEKKYSTLYQTYRLKELPPFGKEFEDCDETMVPVKRKLLLSRFRYSDDRLLTYQHVLDTLEKLRIFEASLLSQKAEEILQWSQDEKKINRNAPEVIFDSAEGICIDEIPQKQNAKCSQQFQIELPEKEYVFEDYEDIPTDSGMVTYRKNLKSQRDAIYIQKIPFSWFEEENFDES